MRRLRAFFVRLGAALWPRHRDRQLADELNAHLELAIDDHIRAGMTAREAGRRALAELGGAAVTSESYLERQGIATLEAIGRDLRYTVRILRNNPAFTAAATCTLALAIGANTVMFSVLNAVVLKPLPYESPDQLAMLWTGGRGESALSRPAYVTVEEWRRESKSFADMAVLDPVSVTLTDSDGAAKVT